MHTILDNGSEDLTDFADMLEDGLPIPVRCQLRKKTAVKFNGQFELPLVVDIEAALSGETGELLTLSLNGTTTAEIPVGDYILDAFAMWSDHEEQLLMPESVKVVNWPTREFGLPEFPSTADPVVPSFVEKAETALND